MTNNLQVISYNCRGLNDNNKRQKLFSWLENEKYNIICLQETFCTKTFEPYLKSSWKGSVLLSLIDSSHSRGVAVMLKQNFKGDVISSFSSKDGRILLINVQIHDTIFTIVSVYAPTSEGERGLFFEKLTQWILKYADNLQNVIVAGDMNCCLHGSDRFTTARKVDKSVDLFEKLLLQCTLKDSWLFTNPNTLGYTYYDKKSSSYSRIDYILISQDMTYEIQNNAVTQPIKNPGVRDHSALKISFKINLHKKGPGYWKLNNSILNGKEYNDRVKEIITETSQEYQYLKSYQLIWELVKINIKDFSMSYCKTKSNQRKDIIKEIQNQLDKVNKTILTLDTKDSLNDNDRKLLKYNNLLKSELESKQRNFSYLKAKGSCIRAQIKWVEEGDVPSKYFLNIEKQRQTGNVITKICDEGEKLKMIKKF